jgi:hypothetical protein
VLVQVVAGGGGGGALARVAAPSLRSVGTTTISMGKMGKSMWRRWRR